MTHVNGIAGFRSRRKISKDCRFFGEMAVSGSNAVLSMAKNIYMSKKSNVIAGNNSLSKKKSANGGLGTNTLGHMLCYRTYAF